MANASSQDFDFLGSRQAPPTPTRHAFGAARTKLTNAWFDSKLRVTSTLRNWRTVLKLGELVATQGRRQGVRAKPLQRV